MRDDLEERLAARLGTLGATVDDELLPPVDLEVQVLRRRRRSRSARRWSSLAVAASIVVVAATTLAAVHGSSGHGSIQVESSSTTVAQVIDSLQPGTVMLSARGQYVISLDVNGHTNATMVTVQLSNITYVRATDDHRQLWYLSLKNDTKECGDVVRADIWEGNVSKIVTHAVAFDVSPDGSRLALYGAGDLAHDQCTPVKAGLQGRIVVLDLASGAASATTVETLTSLRWSPDGSSILAVRCATFGCGFQRIDVPAELGAPLVAQVGTQPALKGHSLRSEESIAFGPDGLFALEKTVAAPGGASATTSASVNRYDAHTFASPTLVFSGGAKWDVSQVIPTAAATYVVAAPIITTKAKPRALGHAGLYRVVAGRLVFVRSLESPGTLTPVTPLPGS